MEVISVKKALLAVLVVFMMSIGLTNVYAASSEAYGDVNLMILDGFLFDMDNDTLTIDASIANISNKHISELTNFTYKIIDLDRGLDVTSTMVISSIKPNGGIKVGSSIKHRFIITGVDYPFPLKNIGMDYKYIAKSVGNSVNLDKNVKVYYNGTKINFDVQPKIKNGRTLVPIRFISETLGANINWDGKTNTITINHGADVIKLKIGSEKVTVNGNTLTLDVPAELDNGRTMVPVRFIADALHKTVQWGGTYQQVIISD